MKKIIHTLSLIVFLTTPAYSSIYTYDDLNRLTSVQYTNGNVIEYDYDMGGNMTAVRYVTPTDSDGDGLPDAWEQQIIDADPNDSLNTFEDVLAFADFDGDGINNNIEYNFDTDPTNKLSPALGDLNIDKEVTLSDAVIALQVVIGNDKEAAIGAGISSLNDIIEINDALYILQHIAQIR